MINLKRSKLSITLVLVFLVNCLAMSSAGVELFAEEPVVDQELPSAPTSITIDLVTDNSVTMHWNESSDNVGVAGYLVYNSGVIISENITETSITVSGLIPDTQYSLTVKAKDTSDNLSVDSDVLEFTTLLSTPLVSTEAQSNKITLSWEPVSNATGYLVEADGVITEVIENSFVHNNLPINSEHTYRIKAENYTNECLWSDPITTSTSTLSFPGNLLATQTFTSITISWDIVLDAEGYEIEVDEAIVPDLLALSYTHSGLAPNSQHNYRVRSKNSGGVGDWSEIITVNTISYGSGTSIDPYNIVDVASLNNVKNNLSAYYRLINNIDLQNQNWTPIGKSNTPFTGTFEGNGYTISNLKIDSQSLDDIGFFGYINVSV